MSAYPDDIYAEPAVIDVNTLANLGPLAPMAGIWEGQRGVDIAPKAAGPRTLEFWERIELQPVDPGNNGPQLLYALRYHTRMTKVGQTGLLAVGAGQRDRDAQPHHPARADRAGGGQGHGRCQDLYPDSHARRYRLRDLLKPLSRTDLEQNFRTDSFEITITIHDDGTWSYDEDTVMQIKGRTEPFHHIDRNRLTRVEEPTKNPLAD